jgi:hypothetical protein
VKRFALSLQLAYLYDVLDHFSESLAIVQTVSSALQRLRTIRSAPPSVGRSRAFVTVWPRLVAVHEEFDLAFPGVEP